MGCPGKNGVHLCGGMRVHTKRVTCCGRGFLKLLTQDNSLQKT